MNRKINKKLVAIGLCIILSITILFVKCGKQEVINDIEKEDNNTESKYTKEYIKNTLEKDKIIEDVTWSKDNSMVVFTKDIDGFEKQLYIWSVGEESEKQIEGVSGNLYDINYSPNDKYITVNEGTSSVYETIIITTEDFKIVDRVVSTGGPVWSPNSEKIAFAVLNDKEPIIPMELSGTTDLMIYDINENTKTVVVEAENDFSYIPLVWDKNGLKYEKSYFDDRKPEEFIYNGENNIDYSKFIGFWDIKNSKLNTTLEIVNIKDNFIEGNIISVYKDGEHISDAYFDGKIENNKVNLKFVDSFMNEIEGTLSLCQDEIILDLEVVKLGSGWNIETGHLICIKYEDTAYDITTETYTEKTENIEVEIKYPVVINMGNKEVEEKINNIIIEKAGMNLESDGSEDEDFKETLYTGYEITKKSNDILSIYFFTSLFMEGAAHPSRYIDSVTFDIHTGDILELNDLFKENAEYENILNLLLNEKVKELDFELFSEFKGLEENGFYLKDNSLIIYYQEGIYTPYAYGPLFIEVSLDDINDISK